MTNQPPSRSFLGSNYDHLRVGGSMLTSGSTKPYTIKDIVDAIEYPTNFNVRQSMTGGSNDEDEYLYGVIGK